MKNNENKKSLKVIDKYDLINVFLRSNLFQGSWNFERMQSLGFCYSLISVIDKLYKDKELKKIALKRHLEFFNTQPYMASFILGVVIAMEEKKSIDNKFIDDSSINSIKIGLMGPLAGIGDSIFWGTVRPILSAMFSTLCLLGNFLGPLLFFVTFNFIRLFVRYYGIVYGYKKGISIISSKSKNIINKINEFSSIVGLFIIGSLISKWTKINVSYTLYKVINNNKSISVTVQDVLDKIIPGLLPILLTILCMYALKKNIKVLYIMFSIFIFSLFGCYFNILS